MPTHSLSDNLLPLPATVAMESGSRENRLCQALTKMLARGCLGLFLEAYFHAPYLQLAGTLSGSQSDNCAEQESLSGEADLLIDPHTSTLTPQLILNLHDRSVTQRLCLTQQMGGRCLQKRQMHYQVEVIRYSVLWGVDK